MKNEHISLQDMLVTYHMIDATANQAVIIDTLRKISGISIFADEVAKAAIYCKPYIEEQFPNIRKSSSAQIISAFAKAAEEDDKSKAQFIIQTCMNNQADKIGVSGFSFKPIGLRY